MKIKDGWIKSKLDKFIEIVMGQSPKSEFYNNQGIGMPFLQGNRTFGERFPYFDTYCTQNKKIANKEDIIMSVRAPVGDLNIATQDISIGRGVCALKAKNNQNQFLYYLLKYNIKNLINKESGTVFGSVNKNDILGLEIIYPKDIKTQEKIASILSAFDDKIEINNEMNKTLEEMAQTLFKRWFIDFDFQNENGEPYKSSGGKMVDSELGEIPEGWEVRELKSVLENRKEKINNQKAKVLSAVNTGELKLSEEYFTKQVFSKDISKYIQVSKYDFAYNPSRINIGSIGIFEEDYIGAVSPIYVVFRAENTYHWYFKYLIKTSNLRKEINSRAFGSVRQSLSYKDFSLIKVVYPSQDIISHFNNIYEILYKNQKKLIKEIQFLTEIRDTLLPKLMSGEVEA
ncbi:restriction endonuclease subunit S [Fusobacterium varium]|uniref:restriction endonuclease subunit S n=1 Tax=Fusobacterium varium TaxID=856 RepID=UPI0032C0D7CC